MNLWTSKPPDLTDLLGIPYALHSRDPSVGLDCLTLAEIVYQRLGLTLPMPDDYETGRMELDTWLRWASRFEKLEAPEPYALAELEPPSGKVGRRVYEGHVGVILPDCLHVIHAHRMAGVIVTPLRRLHPVGYHRPRNP